ncbi:sorbitol dehydrogenase-like isoform X2 [Lingula anatina]|uniref:Sorbitol dehydrogenase n=1 Tax=Lingula anatina TaxID=7574 RepID=A0A1S3IC00_LINAN|nr:sorbitol dehydrogenase-like isoform X2 [Lingula anatina]|eukprot:XP_013395386.1 sorbitol dehydrogenase-like isoform X2 [Lingula anatina]
MDKKISVWRRPLYLCPKRVVQLAVKCVGICGSDLHYFEEGRLNKFVVKEPLILGHEVSGTVKAVGEGVTNLIVGDRVAVEPGVPCRRCEFCMEGKYNLCPNRHFCGAPPVGGAMRPVICHPAEFCYKLPDHVTFEEGMLMEPLAVAVHACARAEIKPGSSLLITGAGPIGIMVLIAAKAMGASNICVTDLVQSRVDFAKGMGASHTVLVKADDDIEVTAAKVSHILGCGHVQAAVDTSGAESAVQLAILVTKPGRIVATVGLGPANIAIPLNQVTFKQIDLRGCRTYCNNQHEVLNLVASGQVDIKPLVSHRFPLDQALEAFDVARGRQGMKCVLQCSEPELNGTVLQNGH